MRKNLESSIRYLYLSNVYHRLSAEEILSELEASSSEEKVPDVIDLLRETGLQEGLKRGWQEGRQEDIEILLRKKLLSPAQIAEVPEVDAAWVADIARSLEERDPAGSRSRF